MKLEIRCPKCGQPYKINVDEDFFKGKPTTCPNNHEYYFYTETPKYAILFNLSIEAFKNEYYFEAFQTLYTGFEVFKQDFVANYYYNKCNDWKKVENLIAKLKRSDQIDCAYSLAYSEEFGELPASISNRLVTKRNSIIHNGEIPSKSEIIKLGNTVFKFVCETLINTSFSNDYYNQLIKRTINNVTEKSFTLSSFVGLPIIDVYSQFKDNNDTDNLFEYYVYNT